jgi:hypothetical protein
MLSFTRFKRSSPLRQTVVEEVPSTMPFLLFEDVLLEIFGGLDEQLATATAGAFLLIPGRGEWKDLLPQTSEKTLFILFLCFTRFLKALYSFMVDSPIIAFTFFSTSSMNSSAL